MFSDKALVQLLILISLSVKNIDVWFMCNFVKKSENGRQALDMESDPMQQLKLKKKIIVPKPWGLRCFLLKYFAIESVDTIL